MEVNELQIRSQLVQTLLGFALVFLLVCAPVGAANVKLEFSGSGLPEVEIATAATQVQGLVFG
jgi:hypothetical protein